MQAIYFHASLYLYYLRAGPKPSRESIPIHSHWLRNRGDSYQGCERIGTISISAIILSSPFCQEIPISHCIPPLFASMQSFPSIIDQSRASSKYSQFQMKGWQAPFTAGLLSQLRATHFALVSPCAETRAPRVAANRLLH